MISLICGSWHIPHEIHARVCCFLLQCLGLLKVSVRASVSDLLGALGRWDTETSLMICGPRRAVVLTSD